MWLIPAVPEAGLLLALAWSAPRHRLEQMGRRRTVALALVGVITAANVVALVALIASLLGAQERSGGELLLKGATIWSTNVITFGPLFWEFDRGGPIRRRAPDPPPRDFQFHRMRTRHSPSLPGTRGWPTTCTSRSPTRSRSARRTRCR